MGECMSPRLRIRTYVTSQGLKYAALVLAYFLGAQYNTIYVRDYRLLILLIINFLCAPAKLFNGTQCSILILVLYSLVVVVAITYPQWFYNASAPTTPRETNTRLSRTNKAYLYVITQQARLRVVLGVSNLSQVHTLTTDSCEPWLPYNNMCQTTKPDNDYAKLINTANTKR